MSFDLSELIAATQKTLSPSQPNKNHDDDDNGDGAKNTNGNGNSPAAMMREEEDHHVKTRSRSSSTNQRSYFDADAEEDEIEMNEEDQEAEEVDDAWLFEDGDYDFDGGGVTVVNNNDNGAGKHNVKGKNQKNNDNGGGYQQYIDYSFDNCEDAIPTLYKSAASIQHLPSPIPSRAVASLPGGIDEDENDDGNDIQNIQEMLLPTVKMPPPKTRRFQPQKRKIRRLGQTKEVLESEEATKRRTYRQDRHTEMFRIRQRWKKRRLDFQMESDFGNAIKMQAKRKLEDEIRREELQKRKKQKLDQQEQQKKKRGGRKEDEDDESLDEQKILLERMTQNSGEDHANQTMQAQEKEKDYSILHKDQMNYWEYGKTAPDKSELKFDCSRDIFHYQQGKEQQRHHPSRTGTDNRRYEAEEPEEPGLKVLLSDIMPSGWAGKKKEGASSSSQQRYFFPKNELPNRVSLDFNHIRYLRSVSFRYLCGGMAIKNDGDDMAMKMTENRLLRHLHSKARNKQEQNSHVSCYSRQASLLTIAQQRGQNLRLYLYKKWTNPEVAAQRLLLPRRSFQESNDSNSSSTSSLLVGQSLKPKLIHLHFEKLRSKAQNLSCSKDVSSEKSVRWMPNMGDDNDDDDDEEDNDHENQGTDSIDGRTNVAVSPPTGWKRKRSPVDASDATTAITTSAFANIPGTSPPVPSIPVDVLGLTFGPIDRHWKHFHTSQVDEAAYRITNSVLLTRFFAVLQQQELSGVIDGEETDIRASSLRDQIEAFARNFVTLHESKMYKFHSKFLTGEQDIPLVAYYKGFMGVCGIMANKLSQNDLSKASMQPISRAEFDANRIDADQYSNDLHGPNKDAAEKMHEFSNRKINHNGLIRFPRAHLTYALSTLCRELPEACAEILSRATDVSNIWTILDLFKEMIERLEADDMIVQRKRFAEDSALVAAELEYKFYAASKNFQKCLKVDPLNPDYHLWHIGSLATCLLVSSGNRIDGKEAHRFPSGRKEESRRVMMHSNSTENQAKHEVRCMLDKYFEVRLELSKAVRFFFTLARNQNGPRAHQGIVSLLRWGQVVALLAGDKLDSHCEEISNLHWQHVLRWSLNTRFYRNRDGDQFNGVNMTSLRARELENNPGSTQSWRNFVQELGFQLGEVTDDNDGQNEAHRIRCDECEFLRKPFLFNHEACAKIRSNEAWWGKNRDWWISGLLQSKLKPPRGSKNQVLTGRNQIKTEVVLRKLESRFLDLDTPTHQGETNSVHCTAGGEAVGVSGTSLVWLPDDMRITQYPKISLEERAQSYESRLPHCLPVLEADDDCDDEDMDSSPAWVPSFSGDASTAKKLEIFCYQVLVLCKLRPVDGTALEKMIHPLVMACWNTADASEDKDEFRALLWLCEKTGLDIPRLLRRKYCRQSKLKPFSD